MRFGSATHCGDFRDRDRDTRSGAGVGVGPGHGNEISRQALPDATLSVVTRWSRLVGLQVGERNQKVSLERKFGRLQANLRSDRPTSWRDREGQFFLDQHGIGHVVLFMGERPEAGKTNMPSGVGQFKAAPGWAPGCYARGALLFMVRPAKIDKRVTASRKHVLG